MSKSISCNDLSSQVWVQRIACSSFVGLIEFKATIQVIFNRSDPDTDLLACKIPDHTQSVAAEGSPASNWEKCNEKLHDAGFFVCDSIWRNSPTWIMIQYRKIPNHFVSVSAYFEAEVNESTSGSPTCIVPILLLRWNFYDHDHTRS